MKNILETIKSFIKPELEIIEFTSDDIITVSGESGDFGNTEPGAGDVLGG